MSATVPSREFVLPTSPTLQAKPTVIADRKWMAHLAKHPLGANALRQHKPWNDEGFDQLSPPTVDHDERERFLSLIRDADSRGGACGVREFARGPIETSEGQPACYEACPEALVRGCNQAVRAVGDRYRALVDESLAALIDGVEVPRGRLSATITAGLLRRQSLEGLVLLATGIKHRSTYSDSVAQLNRSDGLRISFYLRGRSMSWRTTFRKVPVSPTAAVRTLLDVPRDESMSATFLVARPWWQQQQVPLR
jgi:hypothetical protein